MNLTLMLLLLSYTEPKHKDLELVEAPQAVCPLSLWEYHASLAEIKAAILRTPRGKI